MFMGGGLTWSEAKAMPWHEYQMLVRWMEASQAKSKGMVSH